MRVRRERPSQRLHHRVSAPIVVLTDDGEFTASDWSIGGFGLTEYPRHLNMGDELDCTVNIPFQGFDISFPVKVEIVRATDDGSIGAAYKEVGDREKEIMTHFIDDLVRGSITSVDDALLRIDTPVTPVSTKPDPNPSTEVPLRRRSLKTIAWSTFYFTAGLAVIAYASLVLYSNFYRLEVDTAVVSAPVEPIFAPVDGKIADAPTWLIDKPIEKDAPLIVLEDGKLQLSLEMAKVNIDRKTLELRATKRELDNEKSKLKDYRSVALTELRRSNRQVKSLKHRVSLARKQFERYSQLLSEGWTTRSRVDAIESDYSALAQDLEEARLLMHQRRALLDSIEQGRFFNGDRFVGQVKELTAAMELALDEVMLAKDELSALKRRKERLVLRAPNTGRLIKLMRQSGSNVKKGEEIALFEREEDRLIEAFLTQEEVLEIGLGDDATVYFPSLDERVNAVISSIDRTSGYIDEMGSRYEWRGPKDRSALVRLNFVDVTRDQVRRRYTPGLPASVIFERRETDEARSLVKNRLKQRTGL
jgi:multidrug resistance efflux pump